ncbi:MAG TPA: ABC transporter permease subunit [Stellaceae bacterium]|nr:ABC transporter permease subunit [Stellaceae bacterium]
MSPRASATWRRWAVLALPYAWLTLFFLVPFAIVFKISLAGQAIGIPPYTPLLAQDQGGWHIQASAANYAFLLSDSLYAKAYLNALKFTAIATVICLLIGYPMAYAIARAPDAWRTRLLLLVILPFWTSFLIRVYAWIGLLKGNGLINNALMDIGLVHEPLALINNAFSVQVGLVYSYLPYMILPLYASLEKLDWNLLEAASDLGARPLSAFLSVTLPLSLPGIAAGALLVFIPMVGEFVIPDLLGGPDTLMIGKVLWDEFFTNHDWPVAASVAVALLALLIWPMGKIRGLLVKGAA